MSNIARTSVNLSLSTESYIARQLNSATCKNWYGTIAKNGKFQFPLFPFPGSKLWSDDGTKNEVRGGYSLNGILYIVIGNKFRVYNDAGGYKDLGLLKTSTGKVKFLGNDFQVGIYDFMNGYVYQLQDSVDGSRKKGDFYAIETATSTISQPVFKGVGSLNDMTASGTFTGIAATKYQVMIDGSTTPYISAAIFVGSGKNDLKTSGIYTSLSIHNYVVQIDGNNGTVDTFKWSDANGQSWNQTNVPLVVGAIGLNNGVYVTFAGLTGHSLNDRWTFTCYPAGQYDTFRWSNTNGTTWAQSNVVITGGDQELEFGITISFLHTTGHVLNDYWTFETTTNSVFYPPLCPSYLDTYGIYPRQDSKFFYVTETADFGKISALTYAQANAWPDNLIAGMAINKELVLICQKHTEFWYDIGSPTFPFQPRPNLLLNYGMPREAVHTLVHAGNNSLFWVGQNKDGGKRVVMMQAYTIKEISDEALNQKFMDYDLADSFAFPVEWQGHVFYFLTIPKHDITWVYDLALDKWYQRTTRRKKEDVSNDEYVEGRYLANCHIYHNGMHLVGDYRNGKIYNLDQNYFKDGDETIICELITNPLNVNLNRLSIYSFEFSFELGVGDIVGDSTDPTITLQHSKDGGFTWTNEIKRSLGKIGENKRRVKFNKLGIGRDRIFKLRNSDPVFKVFMGAVVELEDTGS